MRACRPAAQTAGRGAGAPHLQRSPSATTGVLRMTKRIRAKHKIDRRLGQNIWGRPKSPINKRETRPGQHGERRSSKLSDYGQQLRAKQKLKGYYANITERQFNGIYQAARRFKGSTS